MMEVVWGMFGTVIFIVFYAAALVVPIAVMIWAYHAVRRLTDSMERVSRDLARIADSAEVAVGYMRGPDADDSNGI